MTQYEKMYNALRNPWVLLVYAILLVLAYFFADQPLALFFHHLQLRVTSHGLNVLTLFGKAILYLVFFTLAGLYFRYVNKQAIYEQGSWYLLGCVLIPNLFCFVFKIALSRARPDLLFTSHYYGFYWFKLKDIYWSFPSGHAITTAALASGLGVLFPRYFYAFLSIALLVTLSRVLLYRHYLSDVMLGFYVSILLVGYFTDYLCKHGYLKKLLVEEKCQTHSKRI
jgi:membrane-associated phospholipid phosphatase